jgi:nucleotide-binding universal stress UspA family protein
VFDNILLPVDLTDRNAAALRAAVELANPEATITLLHVIETIQGSEFRELDDFYAGLAEKAEDVMEKWCSSVTPDVRESRTTLNRTILYGRRDREILSFAEQEACDLILVSSHQIDAEHPSAGLGTISQVVGLLASCTVMLLRSPEPQQGARVS